MEIEVGEFVRTDKGIIYQYNKTIKKDIQLQDFLLCNNGRIVKHSKQLIDLIGYRDLIKFKNTIKVSTIKDDKEREMRFLDAQFCDGFTEYQGNKDTFIVYDVEYVINTKNIKNEDIDYILTHEQFEKNCYRLEE